MDRKMLNLLAPINSLGYGRVGINVLKSLIKKNCPVSLFPIGNCDVESQEELSLVKNAIKQNMFFDYEGPCLKIWHQFDMAQMVGRGLHAGFPIFELDNFSKEELHNLNTLDVIFVASKWANGILKNFNFNNGVVAPFGVDRNIFNEKEPEIPLPEYFVRSPKETVTFLNIGKWENRKGHDFIVEAFNNAFTPKDDVRLVMNCDNPFLTEAQSAVWRTKYITSKMGRYGKITVMRDRLKSQTELAKLIHCCDYGIFPAKAEGWNLDLLEMMSCGKLCIATDYSAHTEYLHDKNSKLIKIDELELAQDGIWFHGQGKWAKLGDSQMEQCVEHLRSCYKDKPTFPDPDCIETAMRFSWDKTTDYIIKGLQ